MFLSNIPKRAQPSNVYPFFLTKEPCQLKILPLTADHVTQATSKIEKTKVSFVFLFNIIEYNFFSI